MTMDGLCILDEHKPAELEQPIVVSPEVQH